MNIATNTTTTIAAAATTSRSVPNRAARLFRLVEATRRNYNNSCNHDGRHRQSLLPLSPIASTTASTSNYSLDVGSDVVSCVDRRLSSGGRGGHVGMMTTTSRTRRSFEQPPPLRRQQHNHHHHHPLLSKTSRSFSSASAAASSFSFSSSSSYAAGAAAAAATTTTTTSLPPLRRESLTPTTPTTTEMLASTIEDLHKASSFNQGEGGSSNKLSQGRSKRHWNVNFVQQTIDKYEQCLTNIMNNNIDKSSDDNDDGEKFDRMVALFLSPDVTRQAIVALQRCRLKTHVLGRKVRKYEQLIGQIGQTKIDDQLSLTLLEAHGKSGNVGRSIQLLNLRKARGYEPKRSEFVYAITSIHAAGLSLRRGNNRNVFIAETDQPPIDDPTRWLDAILLNMNQRGYDLTTDLANRMINTYASTGRSAKSYHFFYRVTRQVVDTEEQDDNTDDSDDIASDVDDDNSDPQQQYPMASQYGRPVKIQLNMRPPPPYHKIPSQVRGKLVRKPGSGGGGGSRSKPVSSDDNDSDNNSSNEVVKQLKLERESDPDWSPVLTSAISFVDSLKQGGACGHDPIYLDLISYTTLMKVCVYRGSLWRAMHILDEVMPAESIEPDIVSFNILLDGLARVGDVPTQKEYFQKLIQKELKPTKETIEAIVDGLLNLGDVGAAITFTQDAFNQYSVLPPYTTQLKILEFALGRGLVFEAKRHVYFIQQLWKWCPNQYHSQEFVKLMELTQKNPKISRPALEKMFAYFGEELSDSDFL